MTVPEYQSTLKLTHFGRRSATPYEVTIWFARIDGRLWIGSLDENKNWVRNLRAGGRARVDFGKGPETVAAEFRDNDADRNRYRDAIAAKYPFLSRVIGLFSRGKKRAVFLLTPVDPLSP